MKSVRCGEKADSGLTYATCVYASFRRWDALRVGEKSADYYQRLRCVCDALEDSLSKRLFVKTLDWLIIPSSATRAIVAGVTSMRGVEGM